AGGKRLMHPDAWYSHFAALSHDLFGCVGPGDNDHAVHATWNRLNVGIAPLAFECLHVWVDREHLVAGVLQPLEDQIADWMATVVARHTGYGDPLLSQKVLHLCVERRHAFSPCGDGHAPALRRT